MHNESQPPANGNGIDSMDYKKVRLKGQRRRSFSSYISSISIQVIILTTLISLVASNRPPRFAIDGQSEIVLRLKESPETKVGKSSLELIYYKKRKLFQKLSRNVKYQIANLLSIQRMVVCHVSTILS